MTMKAIVTKAFPGRPDDQAHVCEFVPGDEVFGELAEVAVRNGWAKEQGEETVSPAKPKGKGRA